MSTGLDLLGRVLAVVGGAAVGGFGVGLVLQVLVKLTTAQRLPRWALHLVRLLGAVAAGLFVALWMFGTGGGGFGWGRGPGTGSGTGTSSESASPATAARQPEGPTNRARHEGPILRIDVLDQKTVGEERFKERRLFQVEGQPGFLTPKELENYVESLKKENPKLEILEFRLVSTDSPARDAPLMKSVQRWGEERQFTIRIYNK
jgi:hypothetical protein